MVVQVKEILDSRKAQFFIITVIVVAGSLSATLATLEDFEGIQFEQVTSAQGSQEFRSLVGSLQEVWHNEIWSYRREINFENARSDVSDFPVHTTLDMENIDSEKISDDCSDLRFTNEINQEEIPYQIVGGGCDEDYVELWLLVDFGFFDEFESPTETIHMYYGNERVDEPEFNTDLQVFEESQTVQTDSYRIEWGERDGYCGFYNLRDGLNRLLFDGFVLHKESGSCNVDVDEGPVFTEISFEEDSFKFFAENPVVIREGVEHSEISSFDELSGVEDDGATWMGEYSTDNFSPWLDLFDAGSIEEDDGYQYGLGDEVTRSMEGNKSLGLFDSTLRGFYVFTQNGEMDEGDSASLKVFDGDASSSLEGEGFFRFGEMGESVYAGDLVYVFSSGGYPEEYLGLLEDAPEVTGISEEISDSFYPSYGWEKKVDVVVENQEKDFVFDGFFNVTLSLSDLDVDSAEDLVVLEDGEIRDRKVWRVGGEYDHFDYTQPSNYVLRFPFDEGFGETVSSSDGSLQEYSAELRNDDGTLGAEPDWDAGYRGTGMNLSGKKLLEDDDSTNINPDLGGSFTVSAWINEDFTDYDTGEEVYLFELPDTNLGLRVNISDSGNNNPYLEGVYYDGSEEYVATHDKPINFQDNEWNHVAYVYNYAESEIKVFIDGKPSESVDVGGSPVVDVTDRYRIGRGFDGVFDEFKIYSSALSDTEVLHQQNDDLTVTFRSSAEPFSENSDNTIFVGGNHGFKEDGLDSSDVSGQVEEDVVITYGQVQEFENVVDRFEDTVKGEGVGDSVEIEVFENCALLDFESGIFILEKLVC